MSQKHQKVLESDAFKSLASEKVFISVVLTVFTMIIYYGFIYLVAYQKEYLGSALTEKVTVGIPIGIGVILLSWIGTGIYVLWANRRYDGLVEDLKKHLEE